MYESPLLNGRPSSPSTETAVASTNGPQRQMTPFGDPLPNGGNGQLDPTDGSPWAWVKAPAPSANGGNGRDAHGRFTKGNAGGPGNPFARRVAGLRRALCAAVSEADIHALVCQLVERARGGDLGAIKLVFAYTIGQPTEAVNPDTLDWQEWQQYRQAPTSAQDLEIIRMALPCLSQRLATQSLDRLEAGPPEPGHGPEAAEK